MEEFEELLKAGYKYDVQNGGAITDSSGRYVKSVTIKGKTFNSDISQESFNIKTEKETKLAKSGVDVSKMSSNRKDIEYNKIKIKEFKAAPKVAPTPDPDDDDVAKAHEEIKAEETSQGKASFPSPIAMVQGEEEGTIFEDITDVNYKNKYKSLQQEKEAIVKNIKANPETEGNYVRGERKEAIDHLQKELDENSWYNPLNILYKVGQLTEKLYGTFDEAIGYTGIKDQKKKERIETIDRQLKEIEKPGAIAHRNNVKLQKEALQKEYEDSGISMWSTEGADYQKAIDKLEEEEGYFNDIVEDNFLPASVFNSGNVLNQITRGFSGLTTDIMTNLKLKLDIESDNTLTKGQMALAKAEDFVNENAVNRQKYEQNFLNQTIEGLNQSVLFMRAGKGGRVLGGKASTVIVGKGIGKSIARGAIDVGVQSLVAPTTYSAAIEKYAGDIHLETNPETGESYATTDLHTYRTLKKQNELDILGIEKMIAETTDEHLKGELRGAIDDIRNTFSKVHTEPMSGAKALVYGYAENFKENFSETYFGKLAGKTGSKFAKTQIGKKIIDNPTFRFLNKAPNTFEKIFNANLTGGRRLIGSTIEEIGEEAFVQLVPTVGNYNSAGEFGDAYLKQISELTTADWWANTVTQTLVMTKGAQAIGWASKNMAEVRELGVKGYKEKQKKERNFNRAIEGLANLNLTEDQFNNAFIATGSGAFNIQDYNNRITELREANLHEEANTLEQDKIYKQAVFASKNGSLDAYKSSMKKAQNNPNLSPETKSVLKSLEETVDEMQSDGNNYLNASEIIEMKSRRRFSSNSLLSLAKQKTQVAPQFHTELSEALIKEGMSLSDLEQAENRLKLEAINKKLSPEASRLLVLETVKVQIQKNVQEYNEVINDLTSEERQEKIRDTRKFVNEIDTINKLAFGGKMTAEQFESIIPILDSKKIWLSETTNKYGQGLTTKERKEVQEKMTTLLLEREAFLASKLEAAKQRMAQANAPAPAVVEQNIAIPDAPVVTGETVPSMPQGFDIDTNSQNILNIAIPEIQTAFGTVSSDREETEDKPSTENKPSNDAVILDGDELDLMLPLNEPNTKVIDSFKEWSVGYFSVKGVLPTFEDYWAATVRGSGGDKSIFTKELLEWLGNQWSFANLGKSNWSDIWEKNYINPDITAVSLLSNATQIFNADSNADSAIENEQSEVAEVLSVQTGFGISPVTGDPLTAQTFTVNDGKTTVITPKGNFAGIAYDNKEEHTSDNTRILGKKDAVEIPSLNTDSHLDIKSLLAKDKNNPGDKLDVRITTQADWANPKIKVAVRKPVTGEIIKYITFADWIEENRNGMSLEEFSKTDAFINKVPMLYHDGQGNDLMHVPDIDWYNPLNVKDINGETTDLIDVNNMPLALEMEIEEAKANTSTLRKQIFNGEVTQATIESKNGSPYIFIPQIDSSGNTIPAKSLAEVATDNQIVVFTGAKFVDLSKRDLGDSIVILNQKKISDEYKSGGVFRNYYLSPVYKKDGIQYYQALRVLRKNEKNEERAFTEDIDTAKNIMAAHAMLHNPNQKAKIPGMTMEKALKMQADIREATDKKVDIGVLADAESIVNGLIALQGTTPEGGFPQLWTAVDGSPQKKNRNVPVRQFDGKIKNQYFYDALFSDQYTPIQNTSLNSNKAFGIKVSLNADGTYNVEKIAPTYEEFLKTRLQTDVMSYNMGTQEKPQFTHSVQPTIKMTPIVNEKTVQSTQQIENVQPAVPVTIPVAKTAPIVLGTDYSVVGNDEIGYDVEHKEDGLITDGIGALTKEQAQLLAEAENNLSSKAGGSVKTSKTELTSEEQNAISEARELLRKMNSLNDIESDVDMLPPTMDDVEIIAGALKTIGGLSSEHQLDVISVLSTLINKNYSPKKIEGQKNYKVLVKEAFDLIYTNKLKELDNHKEKIEAILAKFPNSEGLNNLLSNINATKVNTQIVVDHYPSLFEAAQKEVIKKGLLPKDENSKLIEDLEKETIDESSEKEAYEKDFYSGSNETVHKEKISAALKRLFSTIYIGETGFLGAEKAVSLDVVYNMVATYLTSPLPTDPSFEAMKARLKLLNLSWVNPLIEKLDNSPKDVQNAFVSNMYKYAANAKFVMFTQNSEGASGEIWYSNANNIEKKIKDAWYNNFKTSSITDGDYLNPAKLRALASEYESWGVNKIEGSTDEQKRDWLASFGIVLSDQTWNDLKKGKFVKVGKRPTTLPFETLFVDNSGAGNRGEFLFTNLYKFAKINMENLPENLNYTENPDTLNPFRDMNAILKGLTAIESKYNTTLINITRRDGGKTVSEIVFPSMFLDAVNKLIKSAEGQNNHIQELQSTAFAQNSLFLELLSDPNSGLSSVFNYGEVGLMSMRNQYKDMPGFSNIDQISAIDYVFHQRAMFQDLNQETTDAMADGFKMRVGTISTPTNSDKGRMMLIKSYVYDLFGSPYSFNTETEDLKFNKDLKEMLFKRLIEPELNRILQPSSDINLGGYEKGASRFNSMPLVNTLQVDGISTLDYLTTSLLEEGATVESVKNNFKNLYFDAITGHIEEVMQEEATESLREIDEFYEEAKLKTGTLDVLNNKDYLAKGRNYTETQKKRAAALDYIINYSVSNMNIMQTISGDPAVFYTSRIDPKTKVEALQLQATKELGVNMGKRMAAMIAPGNVLAESTDEKYIQLMLEDNSVVATNAELIIGWHYGKDAINEKPNGIDLTYQQILDKLRAGTNTDEELKHLKARFNRVSDFFQIENTDGQEYTTLNEHLRVLEGLGRLTEEKKKSIQEKVANNVSLGKDLDLLLQPLKPVYTGSIIEKGVNRIVYIKCSSFPLIPELVKGTHLESLMNKMNQIETKHGKSVRASYMSAVKVGGIKQATDPLNAQSLESLDEVNETGTSPKNSLVLNRINFKIQQDVPFKSGKEGDDMVSMGTQIFKHLFGDGVDQVVVKDIEGNITFNGPELKENFFRVFSTMISINKDNLLEDLKLGNNFQPQNKLEAMQKLRDLLIEEANARNFTENDKKSFDIEARTITKPDGTKVQEYFFKQPLWFSGNSNKMESMFNAIINNRIFKQKIPGNAAVVGSNNGLTLRNQEDFDGNGIVYIGDYRGEELKGTQVLAPSKIKLNGVLIDLFEKKDGEYVYIKKEGKGFTINEDKIDPALFENFTFRTPTSSLGSGSNIQIVGFVPSTLGDLMITPSNFIAQMGQDFDIDKLTNYQFHHHLNPKTGRIERLTQEHVDDLIEEMRGRYQLLVSENADPAKIKKAKKRLDAMPRKMAMKLAQNKFIEIHNKVYSAPSDIIQKKINKVMSMDYSKNQAAAIDAEKNKNNKGINNILSPTYNRNKLISGSVGSSAIAIYAKGSTLNSMTQQAETDFNVGKTDKDGNFKKSEVQIGEINSTGKIGNIKTLSIDNANEVELFLARSTAEALDEKVNTGTDNEKAQVLGRVGIIDIKAVAVDNLLTLRGFDSEIKEISQKEYDPTNPFHKTTFYKGKSVWYTEYAIPYLLHSQPIVQEYFRRLKNSKAIIGDVPSKGAEDKIFAEMMGDYVPKIEDRKNMTGVNLFNSLNDKTDLESQKNILHLYKELMSEATDMKELQQLVDMSNLGKSMWESKEKIDAFIDLVTGNSELSSKFQGIEKLLGAANTSERGIYLDNNIWFEPTTNQGVMVGTAISMARNLFYDYFPYYDKYIETVMNRIVASSGKTTNLAELKETIFEEIKKYITSNQENKLIDGDIETVRKELMFNKDGNTSLGKFISKIKMLPASEQTPGIKALLANSFFKAINVKIGENGNPDLVELDNNSTISSDEETLHTGFKELLVSEEVLIDKNGQPYSIRQFGQDLVSYSHITGGIVSEATQFHRFIPIEYYDQLKAVATTKNGAKTTVSITRLLQEYNPLIKNWQDKNRLANFEQQFYQHLPQYAPRITEDMKKGLQYTTEQGFSPKDSTFKLLPYYATTIVTKSKNKSQKWIVYKHMGDGSYVKIDVLGVNGMSEYNYNLKTVKSLVVAPAKEVAKVAKSYEEAEAEALAAAESQWLVEGQAIAEASALTNATPSAPIIPTVKVYDTQDVGLTLSTSDSAQTILEKIKDNSFEYNPALSEVANTLLDIFKEQVNNTTVTLDDTMTKRGESSPNTVKINPKSKKIAEVFIHEFVHSVTTGYLNRFIDFYNNNTESTFKKGIDIPPVVIEFDTLYREFREKIVAKYPKEFTAFLDKRARFLNKETGIAFTEFELSVLYPAMNMKEFIAISLSNNTEFLAETSKMTYKGTSLTVSQKFAKVMQRLFNAIAGVDNNLAEQILNINLNFIENIANENRVPQEINGQQAEIIVQQEMAKDPLANSPFGQVVEREAVESEIAATLNPPITESSPFGKPVSRDQIDAEIKVGEGTAEELAKLKEIDSKPENTKKGFSYKGVEMDTDFVLGNEQIEALEKAIDHVTEGPNTVLTIQGSAGTGKTTIIGLLNNYLKAAYNSNNEIFYMSPTHAANVQLANANLKNGVKAYPTTIQSSLNFDWKSGKSVLNKKVVPKFKKGIYIIDEASMLSEKTAKEMKAAVEEIGGKIIYLGDTAQIPSPENISRKLSSIFLEEPKVILNKVYRQSPNSLLKVLTKIRNNIKLLTYRTINGDNSLQFKDHSSYYMSMMDDFRNNPEGTVYIAYTNQAVQTLNSAVKQELTNTPHIRIGDKLVGFAGKQSKSPSKNSISNAINYVVTDIELRDKGNGGKVIKITSHSQNLQQLRDKGIRELFPEVTTDYYQLSPNDSITDENITQENMNANNDKLVQDIGETFNRLLEAKFKKDWVNYYSYKESIANYFTSRDLGGKYVYNRVSGKFESYDFTAHSALYGANLEEVTVDKGIDYGYGITAHKSQGMTIDNVYIDVDNIAKAGKEQPIFGNNNEVVNTEKNTLYYVAMSRASKKTVINTTGLSFDETIDETPKENLFDSTEKSVPLGDLLMLNPGILMPNNVKPCR